VENSVTNLCAKFNDDRLWNGKSLVHWKSDNNKNNNNNNNNVGSAWGPVSGSKNYLLSYEKGCVTWDIAAFVRSEPIIPHPTLFRLKFGVFPFESTRDVGVSRERKKDRLISREVIFQEFQPVWPRYLNVTDRRTDNLPWQYRALPA